MRDNILLIGDLTTADNLGAISTSEALIKLIKENNSQKNIFYIDHRSFIKPTPIDGWKKFKKKTEFENILKILLSRFCLLDISRNILKAFSNSPTDDHVPKKFSEYEFFSTKMKDGKILKYEFSLINKCDYIIINGEGNIVNGIDKKGKYRIGARYILFLAYFIKKYTNKYCAIINHTVDPDSIDAQEIIKELYPLLDYISVREPLSIAKLKKIGFNGKVDFVPDALFTYNPDDNSGLKFPKWLKRKIDTNHPFICIGDSSGIKSSSGTGVSWDVLEVYSEIIRNLKNVCSQIVFLDGFSFGNEKINRVCKKFRIPQINIQNCTYHEIFKILKESSLLISGRWHASILSLLGNTPIISWGSDSHKTKAIYSFLPGYPIQFFNIHEIPNFINEISNEAKYILDNSNEISKIISENMPVIKKQAFLHGNLNSEF